MYLKELTTYKSKVLNFICSSDEIYQLLKLDGDTKSTCGIDLSYKQIYPYGYIPNTNVEKSVFIAFDVDIPRVRTGNIYKDVGVHIYLLCHSDLMKTAKGTRIDFLGNIIDQNLDRNDDYGFKLYLVSAKHFMASEEYYGLELYYEAVDWNSSRR